MPRPLTYEELDPILQSWSGHFRFLSDGRSGTPLDEDVVGQWYPGFYLQDNTLQVIQVHVDGTGTASWQDPSKPLDSEHLYEKCDHCHLFVEPNPAAEDGPDIAQYIHLARGNAMDEAMDASHEPEPSGRKANLLTWKTYGPVAMRERFTS